MEEMNKLTEGKVIRKTFEEITFEERAASGDAVRRPQRHREN